MNGQRELPVLVVEDNVQQREYFAAVIRSAGANLGVDCDIRWAHTVDTAKSKLTASFAPRLVFLDHRLPGQNGLEFLQHLVDRRLPSRVLVASSYLLEESDAEHLKVYEAYNTMKRELESIGGRLQICDKLNRQNIDTLLVQAVADLTQPRLSGRKVNLAAFNFVVAESPAMRNALESIKAFVESWQRCERNLLVLSGPRGAGKRFLAGCVAEALNISRASEKFESECASFRSADALTTALSSLSPLTGLKEGCAGLRIRLSTETVRDWSHIIHYIPQFGDSVVQAVFDAVIEFPQQPFILPFETSLSHEFLHQLEERLSSTMVTVQIPPLAERGDDVPQLARHILAEIATKAAPRRTIPPLGRVVTDGLRRHPLKLVCGAEIFASIVREAAAVRSWRDFGQRHDVVAADRGERRAPGGADRSHQRLRKPPNCTFEGAEEGSGETR